MLRGSNRPNKRLAKSGHELGNRDRRAVRRPTASVHPNPEPAVAIGQLVEQHFEVFASAIVLDRNS